MSTTKRTPQPYSFDDLAIGTIKQSGCSLDKRLIERPPGLTNWDWYRHAGFVIRLLNSLAALNAQEPSNAAE